MWNVVGIVAAKSPEYQISDSMGRIAAYCILAIIVVFIVQKVLGKGKKKKR